MLIVKLIVAVLSLFLWHIANVCWAENDGSSDKSTIILMVISAILGITFCVLVITTSWNVLAIAKILLFITIGSLIVSFNLDSFNLFWIICIITVIAWIVTVPMYFNNIETFKNTEVTKIEIVKFSVSEENFMYYYTKDNGEIGVANIPRNSTTCYSIDKGETPYIEVETETTYSINQNDTPPTQEEWSKVTTYKLYFPV